MRIVSPWLSVTAILSTCRKDNVVTVRIKRRIDEMSRQEFADPVDAGR